MTAKCNEKTPTILKNQIFTLADGWFPARHPCEGREGMTALGAREIIKSGFLPIAFL